MAAPGLTIISCRHCLDGPSPIVLKENNISDLLDSLGAVQHNYTSTKSNQKTIIYILNS